MLARPGVLRCWWACTCARRNSNSNININININIVRDVQLAHNHRVDGVTQAELVVNSSREDRLDREGLRRLVASINRYLGEPDHGGGDVRVEVGDALTVVGSTDGDCLAAGWT